MPAFHAERALCCGGAGEQADPHESVWLCIVAHQGGLRAPLVHTTMVIAATRAKSVIPPRLTDALEIGRAILGHQTRGEPALTRLGIGLLLRLPSARALSA